MGLLLKNDPVELRLSAHLIRPNLPPWSISRKKRGTKNDDHFRMNVMGMDYPRSGECFAIEASHSDSDTFQAFLDEASRFIDFQRSRNILIVDNASCINVNQPIGIDSSHYIYRHIRQSSIQLSEFG